MNLNNNLNISQTTPNSTIPSHFTIVLFNIYHFSAFYFLAFFIPLGIVCNVLILLVFFKTSLGTIPSTRVYYIAMAFGELGTVLIKDLWFFWLGVGWPSVALDTLGPLNPHSVKSSLWYCKAVVFMWFAQEMTANLTHVVFSIERVVAIYFPIKAHFIFTQKRAIFTVTLVFIFSTLLSAVSLKITKWIELPFDQMCSFDSKEIPDVFLGGVIFFCSFIMPATLSSVCSVLISLKIISR